VIVCGAGGHDATMTGPPDLSFVAIGYNEGAHVRACLESVRAARLPGMRCEVFYVDGGSHDNSLEEARRVDGVRVLGGDRRRRAAENRNLGARIAQGKYIQFVDGDMLLDPGWPAIAMAFLDLHPGVAAVSGTLDEINPSYVYRVLQLDWNPAEGEAAICGGAAMFRRDVLELAGGFPEDVRGGEEPLLCWRIRNTTAHKVWYLAKPMAKHDLGYRGVGDYWRRCVANGRAYIEVASRCWNTNEPLWRADVVRNFAWAAAYLALAAALVLAPGWIKALLVTGILLLLTRLTIKTRRKGHPLRIAFGYAVHCYIAKVPLAWGQLTKLLSP